MSKKDDQNYIFSLLNDIPEKLSDYQTTPLTNEEMFKYRESLRQNIKKTKSSRKKRTSSSGATSPWARRHVSL